MEGEGGQSLSGKVCYCCKTAVAALFCRADSAFFCLGCDSRVHAPNEITSRHARVWVCVICEQAPAVVTCKADAAALCATCDHEVHSANPLSRRHDRVPVVPFYDSPLCPPRIEVIEQGEMLANPPDAKGSPRSGDEIVPPVAEWLLPNPKEELKPNENMLLDDVDVDRYLDLDLMMGDQKLPHRQNKYASSVAADGVVPVVPGKISSNNNNDTSAPSMVEGVPCYYHMDYNGSKPFLVYDFKTQSVSQSVSSSSFEVGVVPDHNTMAEVSTASLPHGGGLDTVPLSRIDREARVMRYREKRKNRKFEKTIRYASRKAYAEKRPRIKGRFAKRADAVDLDGMYGSSPSLVADIGYGVVPSF